MAAGFFYPPSLPYRPLISHLRCQLPPRGEAYVLCYVEVITTIFFYINLKGLPIAFPWGGRWAGEAGSDEGVPGGFHGVGNRPTGPRWQRDSSTRRHYHIAPSSVTFGASFPPEGKPTCYATLRLLLRYFST